jgi:N-sulfoglucosamine sulfohydrolase
MNKHFIIPAILGLSACGINHAKQEQPNILWITHEDMSPIYGCYGDTYANTPNIDRFAQSAIMFTGASSNAPICSPARSTLITGMYATSLGTQHLRSDIPIPSGLKILPQVLMEAGYYTTNNNKTDYNFDHEGRWDDSSTEAHWRNRPVGKPFFSVFNFGITHEGPINNVDANQTSSIINKHDPALAQLPPFIPDSERMREIWAHKYDLLSVFDQDVGNLLKQLEEDGLLDNTIIFLFADHGDGLPGYKRWLNHAGLNIPFLLHIPEKYKHLAGNINTAVSDKLVGFVDFAPTVITLAGAEPPALMEGKNFLGKKAEENKFTYGYRDRADDCYDMSRSVFDGKYMYVRHFMPQLPYFQDAVIFGNNKPGSYKEIHRLKSLGLLPQATMAWFKPKDVEELFDIENDPFEQNNLANDPQYAAKCQEMRNLVIDWMVKHYDTGLLNEGEYMDRARRDSVSVYEVMRICYPDSLRTIADAAQMSGKIVSADQLIPYLDHTDSAVRYWALVAADGFEGDIDPLRITLENLLNDDSYPVAILAAEMLIKRYDSFEGLTTLDRILRIENEPIVLQAAISLRRTGTKATPLLHAIEYEIMPAYAGNVWGRYRNWLYPMFIGMALDQTMINNNIDIKISN